VASHPIVHIEIPTESRERAGDFYSQVFDWNVQQMPEMIYATWQASGGPGGGFAPADGQMVQIGQVVAYIGTDDINGSLSKIEANGGKTVLGKTEIPGMGWFALFNDPAGNKLGLFEGNGQGQ